MIHNGTIILPTSADVVSDSEGNTWIKASPEAWLCQYAKLPAIVTWSRSGAHATLLISEDNLGDDEIN
jgi:hypothetical protein